MSIDLKWHGHGTWTLTTDGHKILLDPFFTDNPSADITAEEAQADCILVSHGHGDHVGARQSGSCDAVEIAKRTAAPVLAIYEVANWLIQHGCEKCTGMNMGGKIALPFATVKMVPAMHSNSLPDGTYGGMPAGFVIETGGKRIYFACDTALFSDMRLIGESGIDVAVLPIGDLFTMGMEDSIRAIKLISPTHVLPAHYNTWPPIEQDAEAWATHVRHETNATPHTLKPGEVFACR